MPDHVHLLLEGSTTGSSATRFISRAKQASGYWYAQRTGQRLWQRSSWDRVLRREDDTWTVIKYILSNPVRAGIVERPLDYPFSGSMVYERVRLLEAFMVGSSTS